MYSFAVIIWEVAAREDPYGQDATLASIAKAVSAGVRPDVNPAWPSAYIKVMETSWEGDPTLRKSAEWCATTLSDVSVAELNKADSSTSAVSPTRTVSVHTAPVQSGIAPAILNGRDRANLATMHEVEQSESKFCAIL